MQSKHQGDSTELKRTTAGGLVTVEPSLPALTSPFLLSFIIGNDLKGDLIRDKIL